MRRRIVAGIISIVLIGGGVYLLNSENSIKGQKGSQSKIVQVNDNFNKKVQTLKDNVVQTPKEQPPINPALPSSQTTSKATVLATSQKNSGKVLANPRPESLSVVSTPIQTKTPGSFQNLSNKNSEPSKRSQPANQLTGKQINQGKTNTDKINRVKGIPLPLVQSCFSVGLHIQTPGVTVNISLDR